MIMFLLIMVMSYFSLQVGERHTAVGKKGGEKTLGTGCFLGSPTSTDVVDYLWITSLVKAAQAPKHVFQLST
jgi:hypothetical protein